MIFLGDIASPSEVTTLQLGNIFASNRNIFAGKRLICNFDGLISSGRHSDNVHPVLFNDPGVPAILKQGAEPVLCLANNHTLDLPYEFDNTASVFSENKALSCGAGKSMESANSPVKFYEGNKEIILFNACWDFLLYNQDNPSGDIFVAEIKETEMIKRILALRSANPRAAVIVYLHWSFDLETIPFPMYRNFSRALIDSGADLVVGTHSHCVQGGEIYKGHFIVYGLGNFFLPSNTFAAGKLSFPEIAKLQLALEWNPETNESVCHWFEYNKKDSIHSVTYLSSEVFKDSPTLKKHTPYSGMNDPEYLVFFRNNRRKRILIPVYKDHNKVLLNRIFTVLLVFRARLAHKLARLGVIKWQN